jgi:N-acetylglucosamine malate deacetylase 2
LNVLAFFAHPDDETMLAGGTLSLLARQGESVHYLSATRGEGGETGEPPLSTQTELGALRELEMACAVQALGGTSLSFLHFIDPNVGQNQELYAYTEDLDELARQLLSHIRKLEAEILLTHGSNGEYGHPAHIITNKAARRAMQLLEDPQDLLPVLYTVQAHFPNHPKPRLANKDDPADFVVDVNAALEQKVQAALCHRTQHALFVRRASQEAGRLLTVPEVIVTLESLRRVHCGHVLTEYQKEQDPLFQRLSEWAVKDTGNQG